jgi:pre-mRNA-splicing factor 18
MDFLQAEIERKKKEAELNVKKIEKETKGDIKYIRRGQLERVREKEYLEELEQERNRKKPKVETNLLKSSYQNMIRIGPTVPSESNIPNEEKLIELDAAEIKSRLRNRNQPITIFGECHEDRILRLQKIIAQEHRSKPVTFKNLLQATEQTLEESEYKGEDHNDNIGPVKDEILEEDTRGISLILVKNDLETACDLMSKYFKQIMKLWEIHLNQRPDEVKRTPKGKLQSITYAQTGEHLKAFFKGLRKKSLASDILGHVATICEHMQNRDYMQANDAYIRLAIGNSPWPIGVTNSGIHQRAADDRIKTSEVAHVLNDETTRK